VGGEEHERRGANAQHTYADGERLFPVTFGRSPADAGSRRLPSPRSATRASISSRARSSATDQIVHDDGQRQVGDNLRCESGLSHAAALSGASSCDDHVSIRVHLNARERCPAAGCLASCIPQNGRGLTRLGRGNQVIDRVVPAAGDPLIADRTDLRPKRVIGSNEKHRQLLPFYRRRRATLRWARGGRIELACWCAATPFTPVAADG